MLRKTRLMKRSAMLVLLVFGVLLGGALAQSESVLHTFCGQTGCADGSEPYAGLVFDQNGNLYGTTYNGGGGASSGCLSGRAGCGVVFKVTPEGSETILYSFCAKSNCTDGELPLAGLIFDRQGDLYGTTDAGGAHGYGVVFKLTPGGKETVLYSFCTQYKDGICADGRHPSAGLVFDHKGNLYGSTRYGGAYEGGVLFRLTPKGKETVLHNFCAQVGNHCADGAEPQGRLILDQNENLYGTTFTGGAFGAGSGGGVVFKLTPKGKETVLYSFCAQGGNYCTDGADPYAGLTFDRKGNLYGTTSAGGAHGLGVVFKLTPKNKQTVLYSFCEQIHCTDGAISTTGLVIDQKGNLYGTTYEGGAYEVGTVFKLTPDGKETVLYNFCAQSGCVDGAYPAAGLTSDQKGNLYGTTVGGGVYNSIDCPFEGCGVVFKLTP